ncbi:Hypothetical protein IALB_2670 [Ignavibacterium album JCM 16511]|uniref:DUF4412 domain-containing protein n=1 Tax=Ignavibacterium album (strain DSM 19864 / JCM 16511 / NBRC 101810 / Mat9-16) TaxID=945713 RepID=I0AN16_IGNAJ|nr:hypothetical protein [Ignavibacterium album]AFH50373.1 Hypothetical protein IALB_2670 [Ignavibacterium album JCM 16511]
MRIIFNKISFIFFIITLIIISACSDSNDKETTDKKITSTDFSKRYGVKSAIVEYVITGSQSGIKTLYFEDWGMKQAEYTNSVLQIAGFSKNINLLNIISDDSNYIIDLERKTGTKTKNPVKKLIAELQNQKSFGEFGEQILLKSGAMKVGREEFLDKDCDIYEIKNAVTKIWIWKWIPLKTITKTGGVEINSVAKKIEINVSIPSDKFEPPKDVTITEVDLDDIENQVRQQNK